MDKQTYQNKTAEKQPEQEALAKRPYTEPRLKKLGSVEQLTQGIAGPLPDDGMISA